MIEAIIEGAIKSLPKETIEQIKSAVSKVSEFLPIIESYHNTIELKDKEHKVGYLIMLENEKIILYQVALKSEEVLQKVIINRTLQKFDVMEITEGLVKNF